MVVRVQRLGAGRDFNFGEVMIIIMQSDNKDLFDALNNAFAKYWLTSSVKVQRFSANYKTYLINQDGGNKQKF